MTLADKRTIECMNLNMPRASLISRGGQSLVAMPIERDLAKSAARAVQNRWGKMKTIYR